MRDRRTGLHHRIGCRAQVTHSRDDDFFEIVVVISGLPGQHQLALSNGSGHNLVAGFMARIPEGAACRGCACLQWNT